MKFALIQFKNRSEPEYWLWDPHNMTLNNYCGGGFDIDENAEYWMTAQIYDAESWHELYITRHWNPVQGNVSDNDVWISPEGNFFYGDAHAVAAEKIVDVVYGLKKKIFGMDCAEDYLLNHHWIKATRSLMWSIYLQDKETWKMTQRTYDALYDYCKLHNLPMPNNVELI